MKRETSLHAAESATQLSATCTPGPWSIYAGTSKFRIEGIRADGCHGIASTMADTLEDEANARLIAAAPDLLAFAERYLDSDATTAECDRLAKAALAKAKGAQ